MASADRIALICLRVVDAQVWITILSYVMVWMAEEISLTVGIPPTVAGVTILAAGTSIPDAISSVLVAREATASSASRPLAEAGRAG